MLEGEIVLVVPTLQYSEVANMLRTYVVREEIDAARATEISALHLEAEIRRESLVRDWDGFLRFLQFAATGSGQVLNDAAVSQETGVSQPTAKSYYRCLKICSWRSEYLHGQGASEQTSCRTQGSSFSTWECATRQLNFSLRPTSCGRIRAPFRTVGGERALEEAPISRRSPALLSAE